jgi:hypothetical protein
VSEPKVQVCTLEWWEEEAEEVTLDFAREQVNTSGSFEVMPRRWRL